MAFNMNPQTNQVKYPFNGQLNPNEVFGSIYNSIINQIVKHPELVDNYGFVDTFRTEGSLFGDTVLVYDSDVLATRPWKGDGEADNLLAIERPDDPECQAITLNKFRICKTSLDAYLSKRAWSTENAYTQFNDIVKSMVGQTKKLYEVTMMNAFLGTVEGGAEKSTLGIPLSGITATGEEKNKLVAQTIAQYLADLIVDMKDYSRSYNDYEFMRAYSEDELMVVFNSKWVNKIDKLSLPVIFNNAGLVNKFAQHILPSRYFGEIVDTNSLPNGLTVDNDGLVTIGSTYTGKTIRSMDEGDFASGHKFAGDELKVGDKFVANKAYYEDEDIICKVITKDTVKYMASFETATDWFNPQALVTSNMLIWGFSEPTRLYGQPCVTVHAN
jgi:hypothetical protein